MNGRSKIWLHNFYTPFPFISLNKFQFPIFYHFPFCHERSTASHSLTIFPYINSSSLRTVLCWLTVLLEGRKVKTENILKTSPYCLCLLFIINYTVFGIFRNSYFSHQCWTTLNIKLYCGNHRVGAEQIIRTWFIYDLNRDFKILYVEYLICYYV